MTRWTAALAAALMIMAPTVLAAPAFGGVGCGGQAAPGCGDAEGDAFCAPSEDCVVVDTSCECRPRVCCRCENVGDSTLCDDTPCTSTALGSLFLCAAPCLVLDQLLGETCNLKVVGGTTCSGDSCPVTGCCTVTENEESSQGAAAVPTGNFCAATDAATCTGFGAGDTHAVSFVPGGVCSGGLSGACIVPSATPTSTTTSTATATATATATPINTRIADGGVCDTPSQCASDFCVDGVCCDTACDGPAESCNQTGRQGTCVPLPAPAPPLSRKGLFSVIALLTAFGVLSFSRRRRFGAAATHG